MLKSIKENLSLYVRNNDFGHLLEFFLISAVSSILVIRFFLTVTNYPQLGGGNLHIAHVLWGGFFMMAALLCAFAFLNKEALQVSAILGGVGFGTFIDELGKFLTSDNDYFYQPTAALIYVIFIGLFLLYRMVEKYKKLTDKEYEVNALEMLKEVIATDFDEREKKKILRFLDKSDSQDEAVMQLRKLVLGLDAIPADEKTLGTRIKRYFRRLYLSIVDQKWFERLMLGFFILISIGNLLVTFYYLPQISNQSLTQRGELVFSLISGILVLLGVLLFQGSKLKAYYMFKRAILVAIFLTQFFVFFEDQFSGIVGLAFNVVIFILLQYLIEEERLRQEI